MVMKLFCSLLVLLLSQAALSGEKWQEVQIGPDTHLGYHVSVKEVTVTPDPDEIRRLKSTLERPAVIIGAPTNPLRIAVFQVYLKRANDEIVVGSVEMPEHCVIDASIGLPFMLMDAKIEGNTLHYLYRDRWHFTLVTVELQENRVGNTTKLYIDYGFWEEGSGGQGRESLCSLGTRGTQALAQNGVRFPRHSRTISFWKGKHCVEPSSTEVASPHPDNR